jgi:hypothetical protein
VPGGYAFPEMKSTLDRAPSITALAVISIG